METLKIAIVPGSFDPVTSGHLDVIQTAAALFDTVYAAVCVNGEKRGLFTPEQRLVLLQAACAGLPNVRADTCEGLMSDYMEAHDIRYLVKGVRSGTDFDYEYNLAQIMRTFNPSFETVILPAKQAYQHISSTYVRELIKYRSPLLTQAVPPPAAALIAQFLP